MCLQPTQACTGTAVCFFPSQWKHAVRRQFTLKMLNNNLIVFYTTNEGINSIHAQHFQLWLLKNVYQYLYRNCYTILLSDSVDQYSTETEETQTGGAFLIKKVSKHILFLNQSNFSVMEGSIREHTLIIVGHSHNSNSATL